MNRRALRKTGGNIDLAAHLKRIEDLPNPWDGEVLFGRQAPLEVEVGSGKGLFLRTIGTARPETDFLGIEIATKYARYAAAQVSLRNLLNVKVVHGDAQVIFRELLPEASLAAVHVYFPDPWWKARHRKRRVMNTRFIADIVRTLRPGGSLHFWTDVEEYFQGTLELLREQPKLSGPLEVPIHEPQHDLDYRTHFERRMRQHNEAVFRAEFRKAADEPIAS